MGGHYVYTTKGVDDKGPWEGTRRYSDFYALHYKLTERWPGFYIPSIPPKKAIVSHFIYLKGNKADKFIQDRRYYLEKFLRGLARYPFILKSEEF